MVIQKSFYDTGKSELPDFIPVGQEPWNETPDFLPKDFDFSQSRDSLAHSQMLSARVGEAVKAKQAAELANKPATIAKETAKGTLSTLADAGLKFLGSAVKAPLDIAGQLVGKSPDTGATIFGFGGPQKTIQGEFASETIPAVESLETTPISATAGMLGQTLSGAVDVLGGAAALKSAPAIASSAKTAVTKFASPVTKPIANFLAQRAEKKTLASAIKAITPKTKDLTTAEYENLLSKKRITPKTKLKAPQYILSEREKAAAVKYKDILQNTDPVKNTISVRNQIAKEDAEVGDFLEKNNGIFNSGELRNFISKELEDVSDVMVPEERVAKLKEQITTNFLASLEKYDFKTLWQGRKAFDQSIEKAFSGSPTLTKEVKKKFRNAIQEYLSEKTPDGVYKAKMKDITDLFNLEDTIQTKAVKERGLSGLQAWAKEHPLEAAVVGTGAGAVGGGVLWNIAQ
jgi:hypothetical protein